MLGVIDAIKRLHARTSTACPGQVEVIFMTTMPHPWCKHRDAHCIRLMNYWRNNGAIRAGNQYLEARLRELQYDEVKVLDTLQVLMPRFYQEEYVCVDHFMCNDNPRGLGKCV
jgi:hypothetical protein